MSLLRFILLIIAEDPAEKNKDGPDESPSQQRRMLPRDDASESSRNKEQLSASADSVSAVQPDAERMSKLKMMLAEDARTGHRKRGPSHRIREDDLAIRVMTMRFVRAVRSFFLWRQRIEAHRVKLP